MIYLDEIKREDFEMLTSWRKRSLKKNFYKEPLKLDKSTELMWFDNINKSEKCQYWIIRSGSLKIGVVNINNIDVENSSCTLEYSMEDNNFKNRGICEEILKRSHEYIYEDIKIDNIYCNIKEKDEESIELFLKIGYSIEKVFKISEFDKNNILYLKLTKKEWRNNDDKC